MHWAMAYTFRIIALFFWASSAIRKDGRKPYSTLPNFTLDDQDVYGRVIDATTRKPVAECFRPHVPVVDAKVAWHAEWMQYLQSRPELKHVAKVFRAMSRGLAQKNKTYSALAAEFFDVGKDDEGQTKVEEELYATLYSTLVRRRKVDMGAGNILVLGNSTVYGDAYFLFVYGSLQSTSVDEYIYHEVLVHTAMVAHPSPVKSVFIGGGAEGLTLREVLRHKTVSSAVMVDIAGPLMDKCYQHLKRRHRNSFDDPRATVLEGNARAYLEDGAAAERTFDVMILDFPEFYIINDCERLLGGLFSLEFFQAAKNRLKTNGVLIAQSPMYDECRVRTTLQQVFRIVRIAVTPMLSYPANLFFLASDTIDPVGITAQVVQRRLAARGVTGLRWYSGATHERLWSLDAPISTSPGCQPSGSTAFCMMVDSPRSDACVSESNSSQDM